MLARTLPFLALGLLLVGCRPPTLNENKTLELDNEVVARSIDLPAVPKAQKVTVEFTSSEGDVLVLVVKEEDARGEDALMSAEVSKALGNKRGKSGSFTVEVPANTKTRVIARESNARKTSVNIKVTNVE